MLGFFFLNVLSSVHGLLRYHLLAHPPLQPGYRRPGNRGWRRSTEAWRTRQTSESRTGVTIQCMSKWINLPPLKLTVRAVGTCLQNLTHSGVVGGGVRALGPSRARISAAFPLVKPWRGGKIKGLFQSQKPAHICKLTDTHSSPAAGRLATQHQHKKKQVGGRRRRKGGGERVQRSREEKRRGERDHMKSGHMGGGGQWGWGASAANKLFTTAADSRMHREPQDPSSEALINDSA